MKNGTKILIGIVIALVLTGGWLISGYNSFVTLDESVNESWANVETQYQRRFDLIPNLVASVQASADFEQSTLTAVTEARSAWAKAQGNGDIAGQIEAANSFDSALSRLLVTVEAYPDIKSTEGFLQLNDQLEGTENRIQFARSEYNAQVKTYNTSIRTFPRNFMAMIFGFEKRASFEGAEGSEDAVKVNFDFKN